MDNQKDRPWNIAWTRSSDGVSFFFDGALRLLPVEHSN